MHFAGELKRFGYSKVQPIFNMLFFQWLENLFQQFWLWNVEIQFRIQFRFAQTSVWKTEPFKTLDRMLVAVCFQNQWM